MSSTLKTHPLKLAVLGLLAGFVTISTISLSSTPAEAVVYCRAVGVPKGCVVRPSAPAAATVIYCTSPGLPVGCVARPVGRAATPGTNVNGGVNRVGVR